MAFTFTNYAGIQPQHSPLNDIIGKMLSGYKEGTNAKYLKKEKEADIFHKQISPLAMLASSPYFSSMHPEQQRQIAGYISQMLGKQGLGGGQEGMGGAMGFGGGGMGQQGGQDGAPQAQGQGGGQQPQYDEEGNSLVPRGPGEHFTGKFTETPYSPGTAHRGEGGETIYSPTGANVQKGIDVATETKGLKKLYDQYVNLAPKVAGAGGFKRDFANIASGIERTGVPGLSPLAHNISQKLGTENLSNEAAKMQALKAQMGPALRSMGFKDNEVEDIFKFYPGESGKNAEERYKATWPVIERKIKTHFQNLKSGIKINNNNNQVENEPQPENNEQVGNPAGDMLLEGPDGSQGFVPSDKAMELIKSGKFKAVQ